MNKTWRYTISENLLFLSAMASVSLLPFFKGGLDHPAINISLLVIALSGLVILILRKPNIKFDIPFSIFSLFIIWSCLSFIWSITKIRTVEELLQLFYFGIVYMMITKLNRDMLLRVGRVGLIAATAIAFYGVIEYIVVTPGRMQFTFVNPNPLGIYMVMFFCIAWGYNLRNYNKYLTVSAVLLCTALFLTGSRGSMLCFAAVQPLLFLSIGRGNLKKSILRTLGCIATSVIIDVILIKIVSFIKTPLHVTSAELTNNLMRIESAPSSVMGRITFWVTGLKAAIKQPLQGFGLGTYFQAYSIGYDGSPWYSRFAHNHYVQTFVELGIVGVVLLVSLLAVSVSDIVKNIRNASSADYLPAVFAGISAFIMHITIDFSWNFPAVTVIFFALLGAAANSGAYSGKLNYRLNYKVGAVLVSILLLIASWQILSDNLFLRGSELEEKAQIAEAIDAYNTANTFYPINPIGHFLECNSYLKLYEADNDKEKLSKALVLAKQAVRLSPYDWAMRVKLAKIYFEMGQNTEVEEQLTFAVKYAIYRLEPFIYMSELYISEKQWDKAETVLLDGIKLITTTFKATRNGGGNATEIAAYAAKLHVLLAGVYTQNGDEDQAKTQQNAADELLIKYNLIVTQK